MRLVDKDGSAWPAASGTSDCQSCQSGLFTIATAVGQVLAAAVAGTRASGEAIRSATIRTDRQRSSPRLSCVSTGTVDVRHQPPAHRTRMAQEPVRHCLRGEAQEGQSDARPEARNNRRCIRWITLRMVLGRERSRRSSILRRSRTVSVGQSPQQNGRVEGFIGTVKRAIAVELRTREDLPWH